MKTSSGNQRTTFYGSGNRCGQNYNYSQNYNYNNYCGNYSQSGFNYSNFQLPVFGSQQTNPQIIKSNICTSSQRRVGIV